jgi:hypothetical protein
VTVQRDFGGFDPTFFGATIRLSWASDWELFWGLRRGDTLKLEPQLSDDERFEKLGIASVVAHEVRHFHDFLITPCGAHIFRLRIFAALNTLQLLDYIVGATANCLPFPISTWCMLNEKRRKAELEWWGKRRDGADWIPVPLPHIRRFSKPVAGLMPSAAHGRTPAVDSLIKSALWNMRQIEAFAYSSSPLNDRESIQSWQVFELSALLVQLREIANLGFEHAYQFHDYLSRFASNSYGAALTFVRRMWERAGERFDLTRTATCVYWSMLGDYERDGQEASPAHRFARLHRFIAKNGWPSPSSSVETVFSLWSKELKLSTPKEGLAYTRKLFHRLTDHVQSGGAQDIKWKEEITKWARILTNVRNASDYMVSCVEREPMQYIDPYIYLENHSSFVNPNIRTIVDSFVKFSPDQLAKSGICLEWIISEEDGGPMTFFVEPATASQHTFMSLDDAMYLSATIGIIDTLFRNGGIYLPEARASRRAFFEESPLVAMKVLSR